MAIGLAKLEVPALIKLRGEIDARLKSLHDALREQLAYFTGPAKSAPGRKGIRVHALKGTKRPAKYRDPASGKTWAGVGMLPLWLKAYEAKGKKRDQFSIDGSGSIPKGAAKKGGTKRGRKSKA
jgi:hypothetical protein